MRSWNRRPNTDLALVNPVLHIPVVVLSDLHACALPLRLHGGVLQQALHRVHVVLNVRDELDHPGQVHRDQEAVVHGEADGSGRGPRIDGAIAISRRRESLEKMRSFG